MYVTYCDMFAYTLVLLTLAGFCYNIFKDKNGKGKK